MTTHTDHRAPVGPADHSIGQLPPLTDLPPIGARVRTVVDYCDGTPEPEPRRGQVVGYATRHNRPGETDDPRPVAVLAVVALDHDHAGWLTRATSWHHTGTLDASCYVSTIVADVASLALDPDHEPSWPGERDWIGWGVS